MRSSHYPYSRAAFRYFSYQIFYGVKNYFAVLLDVSKAIVSLFYIRDVKVRKDIN